jgi:hypothetical protein
MATIDTDFTGTKISEDMIRKGLDELAVLYSHDYGPLKPMPAIRPGAGFADEEEIERFGRLIGVALKRSVAEAVEIDPKTSSTGSRFGYEFDLEMLEAANFPSSQPGKIYAALLEETKFMMDEGVQPEIATIDMICALPPDKRAAEFAQELAKEGRTFRAILQILRFAICKPSIRGAIAGILAAQTGTPAAAATATLLTVHMPWVALYPPAMVTGVVVLITAMGVEGFCAWSGPYLKKYSNTEDLTRPGTGKNG